MEVLNAVRNKLESQIKSATFARDSDTSSPQQKLMMAGKTKAYADVANFIDTKWLKNKDRQATTAKFKKQ